MKRRSRRGYGGVGGVAKGLVSFFQKLVEGFIVSAEAPHCGCRKDESEHAKGGMRGAKRGVPGHVKSAVAEVTGGKIHDRVYLPMFGDTFLLHLVPGVVTGGKGCGEVGGRQVH